MYSVCNANATLSICAIVNGTRARIQIKAMGIRYWQYCEQSTEARKRVLSSVRVKFVISFRSTSIFFWTAEDGLKSVYSFQLFSAFTTFPSYTFIRSLSMQNWRSMRALRSEQIIQAMRILNYGRRLTKVHLFIATSFRWMVNESTRAKIDKIINKT